MNPEIAELTSAVRSLEQTVIRIALGAGLIYLVHVWVNAGHIWRFLSKRFSSNTDNTDKEHQTAGDTSKQAS